MECESASYKDFAVLYRTNAQSRIFEEKFLNSNIPYKIIGGMNFYARKEIKDILAYLKTIEDVYKRQPLDTGRNWKRKKMEKCLENVTHI